MPRLSARPAPLRGAVFLGASAVDAGLLTAHQVRTGGWRRLFRGVYADPDLPTDHLLRCRGARLALPADAAIAGRSAAVVLGAAEAAGFTDAVEAVVPPQSHARGRPGLRVWRQPITGQELTQRGPLVCTAPLRTAWDVARHHSPEAAVPVIDELLRKEILEHEALIRYADDRKGTWGAAPGRRAVDLADGRAHSRPESLVRVALRQAGLDPVPQVVVVDDSGRFVAQVDLGFPAVRVAVEYDGAYHRDRVQFGQDRQRLNGLQAAGWRVVFVTAADLRDLAAVVERVKEALAVRRPRR